MQDFFMGAVVEVEEFGLGENPPETTPPQGVIVARLESDGWVRKYLYKASRDLLSGRKVETKVLYGEIPPGPAMEGEESARVVPDPALAPAPYLGGGNQDQPVRFSKPVRVNIPGMGSGPLGNPLGGSIQISPSMGHAPRASAPIQTTDARLNLPANSSVRIVGQQHQMLGQTGVQLQPPAAVAPQAPADVPLPLTQSPAPAPTVARPAPGLPVVCTAAMQLPDGTVIQPDDPLLFKDFCALLPYILDQAGKQAPKGPPRPGTIPLANAGPSWAGVPSFGPAGSPFGQGGGGGGGGGGSPSGAGPIGVVTGPTPVGGTNQAGAQGPPGPAGPQGPGAAPDGKQIVAPFSNVGAAVIVPGSTFTIVVGGNGNVAISFSAILSPDLGFAQVWDVFMGVQVDATQYILFDASEVQGAGSDRALSLTAAGTLFLPGLPLGTHTISLIFGNNPLLNTFSISASPSQPASISAAHA